MAFLTATLSVILFILVLFAILYFIIRIALYYMDKCNTIPIDNQTPYNNGYDEYDIFN